MASETLSTEYLTGGKFSIEISRVVQGMAQKNKNNFSHSDLDQGWIAWAAPTGKTVPPQKI
jgi:hypothetical protein